MDYYMPPLDTIINDLHPTADRPETFSSDMFNVSTGIFLRLEKKALEVKS
jgi:hypothetical protein